MFWVAVIFLLSELLIWTLHILLRPAGLEFLSSIVGMIVVFIVVEFLSRCMRGTNEFYTQSIKPKVDFLNKNMGLGFAVPLVAIDNEDNLGGEGIGKVIGTFMTTNAIFWVLVFVIALGITVAFMALRRPSWFSRPIQVLPDPDNRSSWVAEEPPRLELPAPVFSRRLSDAVTLQNSVIGYQTDKEAALCSETRAVSACFTNREYPTPMPPMEALRPNTPRRSSLRSQPLPHTRQAVASPTAMETCYPVFLAVFFIIAVGIPVSLFAGDDRLLDGCMFWFIWITSSRLQRSLSTYAVSPETSGSQTLASLKSTVTTLLNPVLLTTLGMTAYTRAKSSATSTPLKETLSNFSSGTSLSDLCSFFANPVAYPLKQNHPAYFGAGDAAPAVLEVGIVVWGFKLYECRRQLASRAGLAVVVVSAAAAVINVFVSSLLGKVIGLAAPEALAFAARSTTLALARPAVQALGGNQVVNAALVVSNGILGQVLYPFVLGRLGLDRRQGQSEVENRREQHDEARVIAAGTSIGINGAAMGVAYLYERKNKAAPYAVLSMTVFGVMTVAFTAVEPFKTTLGMLMRA